MLHQHSSNTQLALNSTAHSMQVAFPKSKVSITMDMPLLHKRPPARCKHHRYIEKPPWDSPWPALQGLAVRVCHVLCPMV